MGREATFVCQIANLIVKVGWIVFHFLDNVKNPQFIDIAIEVLLLVFIDDVGQVLGICLELD